VHGETIKFEDDNVGSLRSLNMVCYFQLPRPVLSKINSTTANQ